MICTKVISVFTKHFIILAYNKYNLVKLHIRAYIFGGKHMGRHDVSLNSFILLSIYAVSGICPLS